jgi:hypothetical protein
MFRVESGSRIRRDGNGRGSRQRDKPNTGDEDVTRASAGNGEVEWHDGETGSSSYIVGGEWVRA